MCAQTSKRVKVACSAFSAFCACEIFLWKKKKKRFKIVLIAPIDYTTELKNLIVIFTDFERIKNSFPRNSMTYGTPCHAIGYFVFLGSPCYLQDAMPCQWSSSDLPRVLRIWESIFYSQAFFTLHFFLLVLKLPWEPAVQHQG